MLLGLVVATAATLLTDMGYARPPPGRPAGARVGVRPHVDISVGRRTIARPIPAGFLGLSIEYWAVEAYAGKDPEAINPALAQLVRNLAPGRGVVLRIGGVSTDKTWWPVSRVRRPLGVNYSLNRRRVAVIGALARELNAHMIMGINLEADSRRVAAAEARALLAGIGRGRIAALELGNEPELYGNRDFAWYVHDGQNFTGRPQAYDMSAFTHDFARIGAALPPAPLAGPTSGGRRWLDQLGAFATDEPRLGLVTVHRYPLQACYNRPASPSYPTIRGLLSPSASRTLANGVVPYLATAHSHHRAFRIDEMNNVSCGDPPGVPDTFAMALWALDALFADARVGVDGVNIHTYPSAVYQLFKFKHSNASWQAFVEPEYYGLLLFSKAAPPGSRLISTSGGSAAVRVWATRDGGGTVRVVLINDDTSRSRVVALRVAGTRGAAKLERLEAPGAHATRGVTLAGRSFDSSGLPAGAGSTTTVTAAAGSYGVKLRSASAALLTLHSRAAGG